MSTDLNSIDEGQAIWASAFKNLCNVDLKGKMLVPLIRHWKYLYILSMGSLSLIKVTILPLELGLKLKSDDYLFQIKTKWNHPTLHDIFSLTKAPYKELQPNSTTVYFLTSAIIACPTPAIAELGPAQPQLVFNTIARAVTFIQCSVYCNQCEESDRHVT